MADNDDTVVAIDVGGTTVKGAVVTHDGRTLLQERRDTHRDHGPDAVVATIGSFLTDLGRQAQEVTGRPCLAGGIAAPGLVDEEAGVALFSANLGWRDVPLRHLLERDFERPVALGHDVRAGAVAEGLLGAAAEVSDFLFLTLGTGVGASLVMAGQPYSGVHGRGGELGHISVQQNGPVCGCGNQGCVEAIASASAVTERYRRMAIGRTDADVHDPETVAELSAHDPVAALVWQQAVEALARAIATYVVLIDADLVVIGGGMANAGERLFSPLRQRLAAEVHLRPPPDIRPAAFGHHAGRLGAAVYAWLAAGVPRAEIRSNFQAST